MSLPIYSCSEPITEPDILESIRALPTEDDLPCDDGEPMETPRHRDQMVLLIESLRLHWADRQGYYVGGNMFVHYDPQNKRRSRGPDFFLVLDVEERELANYVEYTEQNELSDWIGIGSEPGEPVVERVFSLTDRGKKVAEKLRELISEKDWQEIAGLKRRFESVPLTRLIQYVYHKYPETTGKSVLEHLKAR